VDREASTVENGTITGQCRTARIRAAIDSNFRPAPFFL
jgi:hypothetical protein